MKLHHGKYLERPQKLESKATMASQLNAAKFGAYLVSQDTYYDYICMALEHRSGSPPLSVFKKAGCHQCTDFMALAMANASEDTFKNSTR